MVRWSLRFQHMSIVIKCATGIKTAGTTRSPSPEVLAVNESSQKTRDNPDSNATCKHCKKQMLESLLVSHAPECLEKKRERARKKKEAKEARVREAKVREAAEEKDKDKEGDVVDEVITAVEGADAVDEENPTKKPTKKSASKNAPDGPKKSKKRKADEGAADKEPKKKKLKKDEPAKPKTAKPKGPVNVETQCGVLLPNGALCARSLTCKSHSMGAKRSVPGRSLPYDQLLAMYQKRNQAKMQKAALSAAAPLPDDEPPTGPVDSDEEKDAVMAAFARSRPQPLEQHVFVPTARKYKYIRMKEMLGNALGVKGGLFGGARAAGVGGIEPLPGEGALVSTTKPIAQAAGGEAPSRKPSLVLHAAGSAKAGGANGGGSTARKASVASNGPG